MQDDSWEGLGSFSERTPLLGGRAGRTASTPTSRLLSVVGAVSASPSGRRHGYLALLVICFPLGLTRYEVVLPIFIPCSLMAPALVSAFA
jgi:hypothetical protein